MDSLFFWIFILVVVLIFPMLMIAFGNSFVKNPPTSINKYFGYRSKMSMKNIQTWRFAHQSIGKIWNKFGLVLVPFSIIVMLFVIGKSDDIVGILGCIICGIQIITTFVTIFLTELELKKTFDANGERRDQKNV